MKRQFKKIIEIPCEDSSKMDIAERIREYLSDNEDYINGNILIASDRPEAVDVIVYEDSMNVTESIGWMQ